jgi:hypothetical protein
MITGSQLGVPETLIPAPIVVFLPASGMHTCAVSDCESEAFAWEMSPPPRRIVRVPRILATVRTGAVAGGIPAVFVFAVYFAQHHAFPLPWARLALTMALYGPLVGVLIAVLVRIAVNLFDWIARVGYGTGWIANPVSAGTLAGAIAGIVPGAIGVSVFGGYNAPFAGTALICAAFIIGSVLVAVPFARKPASNTKRPDAGIITAAVVMATIVPCVGAAIIAPMVTANAFATIYSESSLHESLTNHRAAVGAVAGAIGCSLLGLHIGLVLTFTRMFRRSRPTGA